jgi:GNAT superfamily N-acetyltransferase
MESHVTGDLVIRALRPEEFGPVADLANTTSATDVRYVLRPAIVDCIARGRSDCALVAESAGDLVAAVTVLPDRVYPGTIEARLAVKPGFQRRGIATEMVGRLRGDQRWAEDADTVVTSLRDDLYAGRSFAERHGFTLVSHSVGYRYDFSRDEGELAIQADRAAARAAVKVRRALWDSERETIIECFERCRDGLPLPYGNRPVDIAARLREFPADTVYLLAEPLSGPGTRPIGITILIPQPDDKSWHTRFSGTVPEHRGHGIAAAVKAAALSLASRAGVSAVTAHNEEANRGIRSVNEALGMKPDVGYWSLSRPQRPGPGLNLDHSPGLRARAHR